MLRNRLLGNVFSKTVRDWLLWTSIAVIAMWLISALYIWVMAASGDAYVTMMADFPDALSSLYGMNNGTAEGLAMSGIYFLIGPLVLLTYAIGLGSSAAVGEEEARSLPFLLSSPMRRRSILLAKSAVAGIGVLVITGLTWLGVVVLAAVLGMDLSEQNVLGASIQLLGMVLLFGALALGLSAWRGSSALGIGVAAGLAVLSYFVTTMLPVVEELADLARLTPWYLFSGADALSDGIDVALLGIALLIAAALFGLGVYTLDRRDLKG
jgi:ABC-type transport system involved in multi-copper enzyme maturation permease subunit